MSGDSFTVMTWGSINGIKQAEGGGAVKHPTIHRTAPITKTQLAPNANNYFWWAFSWRYLLFS